jgi:hypothetical protein
MFHVKMYMERLNFYERSIFDTCFISCGFIYWSHSWYYLGTPRKEVNLYSLSHLAFIAACFHGSSVVYNFPCLVILVYSHQ